MGNTCSCLNPNLKCYIFNSHRREFIADFLMRFNTQLCALVLFTGLANTLFAQTISFTPEHPQPGENIIFSYDTKGGKLEGEEISAVVYHFDGTSIKASDLELNSQGTLFRGEFSSTSEDKVIFVKLRGSHPEIVETNNDKGVAVLMYKEDGKTPVSGAWGEYGIGLFWEAYTVGLEENKKLSKEYLEKELNQYPENQVQYLPHLSLVSDPSKNEKVNAWYNSFIEQISNKEGLTEEELNAALKVAISFKSQDVFEKLRKRSIAEFPSGELALDAELDKLEKISDPLEMEKHILEISEKFNKTRTYKNYELHLMDSMVGSFVRKDMMDKAQEWIDRIKKPSIKSYVLNHFAWDFADGDLDKEGKEISTALKWSKESLSLMRYMIQNPEEEKESYTSPKEREEFLKHEYCNLADTYALALYKAGNSDSAFFYQEIAQEHWKFIDKGINERYTTYMEGALGSEKTKEALEEFIQKGHASRRMKKQYKQLIKGNENANKEFLALMVDMDKEEMEKSMAKLRKQEIHEEAPSFKLTNIDGIEVSLESLLGKVVVLDFWATWCGPCIVSFPGMDKARKKFLEREDVIFLFINTREKDGEEKDNVITFLEKEGYTFEVLMDDKDEMYEAYELEGIPTKVVIDKEGTMRFKKVGYYGDDDKMIEELSLMIEMAGARE